MGYVDGEDPDDPFADLSDESVRFEGVTDSDSETDSEKLMMPQIKMKFNVT